MGGGGDDLDAGVYGLKKCYKNSSSINLNSLISLQHSLLTFNTPYRTFIRLHGSNMAFYLYREPSAIYAVF